MRLQDLNWMEVERYLETDSRIILITGATEQHAYLSLMTDILIPSQIAEAVIEREPVLIAPPLNFGMSASFADFPGTITLSRPVFDAVLGEIVDGLMQQGFDRFLIVNGHSGNQIPQHLRDLHLDNIIQIDWYDWWQGSAAQQFQADHQLQIEHANWAKISRLRASPMCQRKPKRPFALTWSTHGRYRATYSAMAATAGHTRSPMN